MTNGTGLGAPDAAGTITVVHLALIALLAVAALLAIWWGGRRRAQRRAASEEAQHRREDAADAVTAAPEHAAAEPRTVPDTRSPDLSPPPPPPVAPPPPPLGGTDEPVPAADAGMANPAARAADPAPGADPAPSERQPETPTPAARPEAEAPAPAPAPAPTPAGDSLADRPVTVMKGLGPKVAARLSEEGITRVGQLAALSDPEAAALDARLGTFSGRMGRDRWLEQARLLAADDRAGYEATFGKLG